MSITEQPSGGMSNGHRVGIIITTRNRAADLNTTLDQLASMGLADVPLYIMDDASDGPVASPESLGKFSHLTLLRNEASRGLVVNRNTLARIAAEPVLISLDDDSCFVDRPGLDALADYFEANPTVCGVEFDNSEMPLGALSSTADQKAIQMYTGFGHAISRDRFLKVGGYREFFVHMCEERDFGQRAYAAGFEIRRYNRINVFHRRTSVARMAGRNMFYFVRNTLFMRVFNQGWKGAVMMLAAAPYMLSIWPPGRGMRKDVARALLAFPEMARTHGAGTRPLSSKAWSAFRRLPLR